MTKRANKHETEVAADEAEMRSLYTGEVLRERGLCPLVVRARRVGWVGTACASLAPRSRRYWWRAMLGWRQVAARSARALVDP